MLDNSRAIACTQVAIVGGGVAGATAAVHFSQLGIQTLLIEKGDSLVNGPPICHLHAGGNLYPEISQAQCIELLAQSIASVRLYPHTINRRPTIIAVPLTQSSSPQDLLPRLAAVQQAYDELVAQDPHNKVLGEVDQYYRLFTRQELEQLALQQQPEYPSSAQDWMIPFAQQVDLDQLQFPVILVQEYGWSVFRLAASAELTLEHSPNSQVLTNSQLTQAQFDEQLQQWQLQYLDAQGNSHKVQAKYLVNACGYQTGEMDDWVEQPKERMVEFKAAYLAQWDNVGSWAEVVFHGPRGTPLGMAQLTPYADGVFQLHGMTQDITLFEQGLAASNLLSSQPQLPTALVAKLEHGWEHTELNQRTQRAISHVSHFIRDFAQAKVAGKPLYGAQQIPGKDATLRAADVSFAGHQYARIEIVKGSSALEAAQKIAEHWQLATPEARQQSIEQAHPISVSLSAQAIEQKALEIAQSRHYPAGLAKIWPKEIH